MNGIFLGQTSSGTDLDKYIERDGQDDDYLTLKEPVDGMKIGYIKTESIKPMRENGEITLNGLYIDSTEIRSDQPHRSQSITVAGIGLYTKHDIDGDYYHRIGGGSTPIILGDSSNSIPSTNPYEGGQIYSGSTIVGGQGNVVKGENSAIVGGSNSNGEGNSIIGGENDFIGGGSQNTITATMSLCGENGIISGNHNEITDSCFCFISGGEDNILIDGESCCVFGGLNQIKHSRYSVVFGSQNIITEADDQSAILGGTKNKIHLQNLGENNTIIGGEANQIIDTSNTLSTVTTYLTNTIILGGKNNLIENNLKISPIGTTKYSGSFIIGGEANTVKPYIDNDEDDGFPINGGIIGGRSNRMREANDAIILGGYQNQLGSMGDGSRGAIIGGLSNTVTSDMCVILGGRYCKANTEFTVVMGEYNNYTGSSAFIIGNGTASARSNAFRVDTDGTVYAKNFNSDISADYAEYFEWEDQNPDNEDRRGLLVTLRKDSIALAGPEDEILGIISATPSVIGNAAEESWQGKYQKDIFGQEITHMVHYDEVLDEEGNVIEKARNAEERILNPLYDPDQEYIPRSMRQEWAPVGIMGQIITIDDGTCEIGGYACAKGDGIATNSDTPTNLRVIKRIDDTHVKIFIK